MAQGSSTSAATVSRRVWPGAGLELFMHATIML